jgi:hypothetical protein
VPDLIDTSPLDIFEDRFLSFKPLASEGVFAAFAAPRLPFLATTFAEATEREDEE